MEDEVKQMLANIDNYYDFSNYDQNRIDTYIYNSLLNQDSFNDENIKKYLEKYYKNNRAYRFEDKWETHAHEKNILNLFALRIAQNEEQYSKYLQPVFNMDYPHYIKEVKEAASNYKEYYVEDTVRRIIGNPKYFYNKKRTAENIAISTYIKGNYDKTHNNETLYDLLKTVVFNRLSKEEIINIYKILSWEQVSIKPFNDLLEKSEDASIDSPKELHQRSKEALYNLKRQLSEFNGQSQINHILWQVFRYASFYEIENSNHHDLTIQYNCKRGKIPQDFKLYRGIRNIFNINLLSKNSILNFLGSSINIISEKQEVYSTNKELIDSSNYNDYISLAFRDVIDDKIDQTFKETIERLDKQSKFEFLWSMACDEFKSIFSSEFYNEYKVKGERRSLEENLNERQKVIDKDLSSFRTSMCGSILRILEKEDIDQFYASAVLLFNQIIRRTLRKTSIDEILGLINNSKYKETLLELINLYQIDIDNVRNRLEIDHQYNGLNNDIYKAVRKTLDDEQNRYSLIREKINPKQYSLKIDDKVTINR